MFEKFQEIATEGCRASAAFLINNESCRLSLETKSGGHSQQFIRGQGCTSSNCKTFKSIECFSPLPLSQSRTLTSGMEVSLSTLRLSLLLGPGLCIPLSSAVKRFWVWLIDTEQRQCCIGSPPLASSQSIKSFQTLEPLI